MSCRQNTLVQFGLPPDLVAPRPSSILGFAGMPWSSSPSAVATRGLEEQRASMASPRPRPPANARLGASTEAGKT
jgi:hypothetical protein